VSKQKTEIKPGQIWREKRALNSTGWKREVLVIGCAEGPAPGGGRTTLRITYEPHNYTRQGKGRGPVAESCFRGDYELVSAPTEAQKEQRGAEG